ncbi:MAG TPA: sigma-70 family RNA polymerase sigma factor [Candidatus Limnocylindrales bacterium]|jgi:RNA polymerase sigma-70 factor (ECF subfamily)
MATEGVVRDGSVDVATGPAVGPVPDTSLVREMIEGSQEALAGIYDRHGGTVFAAAMRASGDRWIAAEVVQETFLALWNRAELFDPSRGALSAWLAAIARNRAVDRLRAAARHERAASFSSFGRTEEDEHAIAEWLTASGQLIGAAGPAPGPEIALSDKETRASIEEALGSLDPVERRVIVLAYDGGLSQSEIAASLGWPIGTVKTRTRRALRHLRDRLERPGAGVSAHVVGPQRGTRGITGSTQTKLPAVGVGECLAPC